MTLANQRGVGEVLHFTTNKGVVGVLAFKKLLSRRVLPAEMYLEYIVHNNSKTRPEESSYFDKEEDWLNYVNLSIDEINSRFYDFSEGWEHNADVWWAIFAFDPEVLDHDGVYFATTNNSYEHCSRLKGGEGFDALYAARIRRKGTWSAYRGDRPGNLPTCEQAEVLYPDGLSVDFLRKVYVARDSDADCVRGWLRDFRLTGIAVEVAPEKFRGRRN